MGGAPEKMIQGRTVVLVEGVSDQYAVQSLARLRGRDLIADGVRVLAMGGATNIGHFLERFGPGGADLALAGLYDEAEARFFQRALGHAGFGRDLTRRAMESVGFFGCSADLEDELIRALGVPAVERILEREGDLRSFRIFQQQPAQRGRSDAARLRRFMGTRSGRKVHYGAALVNALDPDRVPAPLDGLLARI